MLNQDEVIKALYDKFADNEYMDSDEVNNSRETLCSAIADVYPNANNVGGINDDLVNGFGAMCEYAGFVHGVKVAIALFTNNGGRQ